VLDLQDALGQPLLPLFKGVKASDEVYFPCCLALLGLLPHTTHSHSLTRVERRRLTFCDWSAGDPSPHTYVGMPPESIVKTARDDEGCLFIRKVKLNGQVGRGGGREEVTKLSLTAAWLLTVSNEDTVDVNAGGGREAQAQTMLRLVAQEERDEEERQRQNHSDIYYENGAQNGDGGGHTKKRRVEEDTVNNTH